jgi:ribosome modulation factor
VAVSFCEKLFSFCCSTFAVATDGKNKMARDIKLGWDVESLNKAYRQGYMAADMGMARNCCPYRGEVVVAAWDAGWEDADQAVKHARSGSDDFLSRIA